MAYSDKVIDHYNNPRNIGSLDKNKKEVGTGLVGAPECFVGDTKIAIVEYPGYITIKELFDLDKPFYVWSYNTLTKKFEAKKAICIHTGKKEIINLNLDNNINIECTPDHNFLTIDDTYQECSELKFTSLRSFYKNVNSDMAETSVLFSHKIIDISFEKKLEDVFTLMVEENNNYVVLITIEQNKHSGIVVKNCGDVMRLQIEVESETGIIKDAKFKTFGCGSAIASSSLATEWIKGKSINDALKIDNMDIVEELSLPPVKIHCSVLAEDAIKSAINDWRVKNGLDPIIDDKKRY